MEKVIFKELPERKLSKRQRVGLSILEGEIRKKAAKDSKAGTCAICDEPCSKFCDSHSIPRFVLEDVAENGLLFRGADFAIDSKKTIRPTGVSKTWLFSSICHKCDNSYFQEYEDPKALMGPISSLEINEIAIKNQLRYAYKRKNDYYKIKTLLEKMKNNGIYDDHLYIDLQNKLFLADMDVKEHGAIIKQLISKKTEKHFYVIDEIDLDYNVSFAYQGFVTLINGFDKGIINNVFNYDPNYKMQPLSISVFPYKNHTKILLFCKDGDNRLRQFYKPYKKLSLDEKLYAINYVLLLYEEEWVVPGSFDVNLLNEQTLKLIRQLPDAEILTNNPNITKKEADNAVISSIEDRYIIKTKGDIFNFLQKR